MKTNKLSLMAAAVSAVFLALASVSSVKAANNSTFNATVNNGVLSTDILDGSLNPVASPSAAMTAKTTAFTCYSGGSASTGTLGAAAQRVYVINPGGADNGWNLTMAATSGATAVWTAGSNTFDFNDSTGSGCTDGADTDTKGGQLTVDPSVSTLAVDCSSGCATTNVSKGSSTGYVEGTTNSVTLMSAAAASDNIWRGYLTGIGLSQTVPAEQPSGAYSINMTMTAVAL